MRRTKFIALLLMTYLCVGFRTYTFTMWDIGNTSAAEAKLFVDYDSASETADNDLPGGHPLAGSGDLTVTQMMNSIFSDFNSIGASYLTLVDTSDGDFASRGEDRTIKISFSNPEGINVGEARLSLSGGRVNDCQIKLSDSTLNSASGFIATVTHELGHCVGLDHPQDTVNAIMSYFNESDDPTLQIDDKMGVAFLYPTDADALKESPTMGFACSPRD